MRHASLSHFTTTVSQPRVHNHAGMGCVCICICTPRIHTPSISIRSPICIYAFGSRIVVCTVGALADHQRRTGSSPASPFPKHRARPSVIAGLQGGARSRGATIDRSGEQTHQTSSIQNHTIQYRYNEDPSMPPVHHVHRASPANPLYVRQPRLVIRDSIDSILTTRHLAVISRLSAASPSSRSIF